MKINIKHVAKLANLPFSKVEEKKYSKQLSQILEYMEKLNNVSTEKIEPTSQVTGLKNVTRDDKITPSLTQDEVVANAKSIHNGMLKVKAIWN